MNFIQLKRNHWSAFSFQDDSENVTRFLMLAREPIIPGIDKPFKVSTSNPKS